MKKLTLITLAVLSIWQASSTLAATTFDQNDYVFVFHLYLNDKGQLTTNRNHQLSYETDFGPYQAEIIPSGVPAYQGDITNSKGSTVFQFRFDPRKGNAKYTGPVDVKSPYYTTAQSVKFYDDKGQLVLTIDTGNTLSCVEDGVCDTETESFESCPTDCKGTPVSVVPTDEPLPSEGGYSTRTWILIAAGVIVVAGLATWFIIKTRRSSNSKSATPPTTPVIQ